MAGLNLPAMKIGAVVGEHQFPDGFSRFSH
jgi:hypothetical protein